MSRVFFNGISFFAIIFFSFLMTSCSVDVAKFHYISIEKNKDIEIIDRRKLNVEGLYFAQVIPTRYTINREKYVLNFSIRDHQQQSVIQIEVKPLEEDGQEYLIKPPLSKSNCSQILSQPSPLTMSPKAFFVWHIECLNRGEKENFIRFELIDRNGLKVGTENIAFEVLSSGYITYFDSL